MWLPIIITLSTTHIQSPGHVMVNHHSISSGTALLVCAKLQPFDNQRLNPKLCALNSNVMRSQLCSQIALTAMRTQTLATLDVHVPYSLT